MDNYTDIQEQIRILYGRAAEKKTYAQQLEKLLKSAEEINPDNNNNLWIEAYKAALEGVKAYWAFLPLSKLNHLQKSQRKFETAIKKDPNNAEMRFLRITIEINIPTALGIKTHQKEDMAVIIQNIATTDINNNLKSEIIQFLLQNVSCTSEQIKILKTKLEEIDL